jgi:ferredoxin-NADP reductase
MNQPPRDASGVSDRRPSYIARIEKILAHASDVRSCFLRLVGPPFRPFSPGMFISIAMPLGHEMRVRPYTIASDPEDRQLFEIVFNRVPGGAGSAWLFERKIGDELNFTGPFGTFVLEAPPPSPVVFVAEATAIAPIRPMIRRILARDPAQRVELLYAADRPEHLLYRNEFETAAGRYPDFHFSPPIIAGDREQLLASLEVEIQSRWIADSDRDRYFYLCGMGAGILALRDRLRSAGFDRRHVRCEKW